MELTFEHSSYSREATCLLGPIDLCWQAQGITAIIGPNGAGKSLFLELAHGLSHPSQGRVHWDGRTPANTKRDRGFVFQNRMILNRSVAGNIALPIMGIGLGRRAIRAEVMNALRQVGLSTQADQPAATLSGGEMQRMALARALIHHPKVLLLDEPTSQLDPASVTVFERLVFETAKSGTPILWVTHNLRQAKTYGDHVIFIADGRVQEYRPVADFFDRPDTEQGKAFLKDAP